jgi:hypothetical protein
VKLLLDECIDRRLARLLNPHQVKTVPEAGWATIKNGRLLALAEGEFDVFITVDRSLVHQQNVASFRLAIVVLRVKSNRLKDLAPLVPAVLAALPNVKKGRVIFIDSTSSGSFI